MYNLIRTSPQGEEREQGSHDTVVSAAVAAMDFLRNEGVATRVEARWYANYLSERPLGVEVTHLHSGYAFRIEHIEGGERS